MTRHKKVVSFFPSPFLLGKLKKAYILLEYGGTGA